MKRKEARVRSGKNSSAFRIVVGIAVVALGIVAMPAFADCRIDVQANENAKGEARVEWTPIPGALVYDVMVSTKYGAPMYAGSTTHSEMSIGPQATDRQQHTFTVYAFFNDPLATCSGSNHLILEGDRKLATATEKRIVPLVGSARGANGADFRTSLWMGKSPLARGRIVFRPTGTVASDADPFIRYQFSDNDSPGPQELYWDDVVAAMGATGTGSLEIIPERINLELSNLTVPDVSVRVYNVTDKGTFGTHADAVLPSEWYLNPDSTHASVGIRVPAAHGNTRRNIGFRTLTPIIYRINVVTPGQEGFGTTGTAPAGITQFGSLDAFVGQPVADNARVFVHILDGYAIGFYTETDNLTNDPTLVVDTPSQLEEVVSWGFQTELPSTRIVN
jgi:hypothetical protein